MVVEIQRRALELGVSEGTLLALARECSHDARLHSLAHMTGQDQRTLLKLLGWIKLADAEILARRQMRAAPLLDARLKPVKVLSF